MKETFYKRSVCVKKEKNEQQQTRHLEFALEDKDQETSSLSGEVVRIQFPFLISFTLCFCEEKGLKKKEKKTKDQTKIHLRQKAVRKVEEPYLNTVRTKNSIFPSKYKATMET